MFPTKAPWTNGLLAIFFQKHWDVIQNSVIKTCLHVLNYQGTTTPLNHTYIAIIFKVDKPRKTIKFRHICLCNIIYRIIVKTIANKLKQILHEIISLTQSAFIPNRIITDNVIIGYECLHKIRLSKEKKNDWVTLKLDINKAYDRVEWIFYRQVMEKLGFSNKWVALIMNCVTTPTFSILINGIAKWLIYPQRGIRQGCPLPPYLFIICAGVFSNLLLQGERQGRIHKLRFSRDITISHLFFANDSLVLTRATTEECKHLKSIFDCYTSTSGQVFNYEKLSMFFNSQIQGGHIIAIKKHISNSMRCICMRNTWGCLLW